MMCQRLCAMLDASLTVVTFSLLPWSSSMSSTVMSIKFSDSVVPCELFNSDIWNQTNSHLMPPQQLIFGTNVAISVILLLYSSCCTVLGLWKLFTVVAVINILQAVMNIWTAPAHLRLHPNTVILANIAALAMTCSAHMQHASSPDPVAVKLKCIFRRTEADGVWDRMLSEIFGPKETA